MILAPIVRGAKANTRRNWRSWRGKASCEPVSTANCARSTKRSRSIAEGTTPSRWWWIGLLIKPEIEKRLEASITTATKLANGLVTVAVVNGDGAAIFAKAGLSGLRREHSATGAALVLLQQPFGACETCTGWEPLEFRSDEGGGRTPPGRCSTAESGRAAAPAI